MVWGSARELDSLPARPTPAPSEMLPRTDGQAAEMWAAALLMVGGSRWRGVRERSGGYSRVVVLGGTEIERGNVKSVCVYGSA